MATARNWVQVRSSDAVALAVSGMGLVFAILMFALAVTLRGQSQEVINDRLQMRQNTIDGRVASIEQLNLPARLAVLEHAAVSQAETQRVNYGIFAAVVAGLISNLIMIRGQNRKRRPGDET